MSRQLISDIDQQREMLRAEVITEDQFINTLWDLLTEDAFSDLQGQCVCALGSDGSPEHPYVADCPAHVGDIMSFYVQRDTTGEE